MTKLIIIRGPSGVGKSTVAKALMERTTRPTVLVDLDYYRFGYVNPPDDKHQLEYVLSGNDVISSLKLDFDVIFDGNFTTASRLHFLKRLFKVHPEENFLFYLDASLEETLKRYQTKTNSRIDTDKMKEVYKFASPVGHEKEVIIPEHSSLQETVDLIRRTAGI